MNVATRYLYVKDVAARGKKLDGTVGLSKRYVQEEIVRGNLKAELITPDVGRPYFRITEEDFLAWEERRRGTQGE